MFVSFSKTATDLRYAAISLSRRVRKLESETKNLWWCIDPERATTQRLHVDAHFKKRQESRIRRELLKGALAMSLFSGMTLGIADGVLEAGRSRLVVGINAVCPSPMRR